MSDPFDNVPFPTLPLRAAAGLAVFALIATVFARYYGVGTVLQPESPVRMERDLRFVDHNATGGNGVSAGGVDILDASTGQKIDELKPGADGFIRATVRGLARERRRNGFGQEVPFHLALHADGSLSLVDPATARKIELQAFGPSNSGAFLRLLTAEPVAAAPQLATQLAAPLAPQNPTR